MEEYELALRESIKETAGIRSPDADLMLDFTAVLRNVMLVITIRQIRLRVN